MTYYDRLESTELRYADLSGLDFCGADLRGASFADADLRDANFDGARSPLLEELKELRENRASDLAVIDRLTAREEELEKERDESARDATDLEEERDVLAKQVADLEEERDVLAKYVADLERLLAAIEATNDAT